MPDYSGLCRTTSGLRRTTSGLLRSATPATGVLDTLPKDQPGPRGNYLLDFLSPLCRFSLHLRLPDKGGIPLYTMEGAPPYAGLWPALSGHQILTSLHFNSYPVRDLCYNPQIHPNTFINPHYTLIKVTSSNIFITPAIQYISIINTYSLIHQLVWVPETRLTHYLVARPGATVDGAKYITRSPRRLAHPATVARHYNTVPAISWPSSPTTQKGYDRYTPIKFIFAIAIEVPDYKNPMIFGINREKNGLWRPLCIKCSKKLVASLTVSQNQTSKMEVLKENFKNKVAYLSEMARNGIKSDFRSKMATGRHFVKRKIAYWSEIWRNSIESDFRSSKMAAGSHFVKKIKSCVLIWMARNATESDFRSLQPFCEKKKLRINLNGAKCDRKWFSVIQNGCLQPFCEKNKSCVLIWNGEKCDQVIFGHPKWPPAAILWKKVKLHIDLKWRKMPSKVIFDHTKWPPAAILWKHLNKNCVLIWNFEKCDRKWFSVIQNGGGGGHLNGQPVNHSGIYTVFALGQIHQF